MGPPKKIKQYVRDFLTARIPTAGAPIWVPSRPRPGAKVSECFDTVDDQIREFGGSQLLGWAIWERPGVFIEGEFHAVWIAPDGTILDLSPRPAKEKHILFAPDPAMEYQGSQIDNIRHPLTDDIEVHRLLEINHILYQMRNQGQLNSIRVSPPSNRELENLLMEGMNIEESIDNKYGRCSKK